MPAGLIAELEALAVNHLSVEVALCVGEPAVRMTACMRRERQRGEQPKLTCRLRTGWRKAPTVEAGLRTHEERVDDVRALAGVHKNGEVASAGRRDQR